MHVSNSAHKLSVARSRVKPGARPSANEPSCVFEIENTACRFVLLGGCKKQLSYKTLLYRRYLHVHVLVLYQWYMQMLYLRYVEPHE